MTSMKPVPLTGTARLRHVLAPSTIYAEKTLMVSATVGTGDAARAFVTSVAGVATCLVDPLLGRSHPLANGHRARCRRLEHFSLAGWAGERSPSAGPRDPGKGRHHDEQCHVTSQRQGSARDAEVRAGLPGRCGRDRDGGDAEPDEGDRPRGRRGPRLPAVHQGDK